MLEKIKKSLRVSDDFEDEILDLICACKEDLKLSGIKRTSDTDPLIIRAVTLYCKVHFGYDNPEAERFQKSYDMLKTHLSLSSEYITVTT
jgi:uncharacterized phage protein (predicted DNA packaging)